MNERQAVVLPLVSAGECAQGGWQLTADPQAPPYGSSFPSLGCECVCARMPVCWRRGYQETVVQAKPGSQQPIIGRMTQSHSILKASAREMKKAPVSGKVLGGQHSLELGSSSPCSQHW